MSFCERCGTPMEVRYRPAGFSTSSGVRVYGMEARCPQARGWFTQHTTRVRDRWPERAAFFGFTDDTIPTEWPTASLSRRVPGEEG